MNSFRQHGVMEAHFQLIVWWFELSLCVDDGYSNNGLYFFKLCNLFDNELRKARACFWSKISIDGVTELRSKNKKTSLFSFSP